MKCKVLKRVWCPLRKGYIVPGEIIEVPERYIKGYLPYVQLIETAKKEPEEKRAKKKKGFENPRKGEVINGWKQNQDL